MVTFIKQFGPKVLYNEDRCTGCGNCVFYCPNDCVRMKTPGKASFNLSSCRGCGVCVTFCPAGALDLEGLEREGISEQISRYSAKLESPKALVFRCQWCDFSTKGLEKNVSVIDALCAGRTQAFHILEAFQNGFDGVMIAACEPDLCELEKAGQRLKPLVEMLKERLGKIGLRDRLQLCLAPPEKPEIFESELEQFLEKLKELK
jgi:coenzyme F420-reducing hydrogenase delta subunit/Pyruvate/2-oxoacid:ferredoxin oxidoreductase delta subunit